MIYRQFITFLAVVLLSACTAVSDMDYQPWAVAPTAYDKPQELQRFSLERTACFGFCPIYKVTVDEEDIVQFAGERFVAEEGGSVSKRLPEGSFKKLVKIAKAHNFTSYDSKYPNEEGSNCGLIATDSPSVIVGFASNAIEHEVSVYQGCIDFEGRENFFTMVAEMDAVLDIDDWIGPREQFSGGDKE